MAIARHGTGPRAVLAAYRSQVHPVFMVPPLAASWLGAALADPIQASLSIGAVHMAAIFFAVYTAHVKDGYIDYHVRGEDDDHPLTARGCRLGLIGATTGFGFCVAALAWLVAPMAAIITLPTWFIGYLHAPQLDVHPVGATAGYPAGIALSIVGGYYAQATDVSPTVLAVATIFLVLLSGVKIVDDLQDLEYDRSIAKRTVGVAVGRARARDAAYGLMGLSLALVAAFAILRWLPPSSVAAAVAFAAVALVARGASPRIATMLLIRGAYVFMAVLLATVVFLPGRP